MFLSHGFAMKMKVILISFAQLLLHINRLINSVVDTYLTCQSNLLAPQLL